MSHKAKALALIVGIGTGQGTGGSCAHVFASNGYDLALVGRRAAYDTSDLEKKGIKAKAFQLADYSEKSVQDLFKQIKAEWPSTPLRVSIYNATPGFSMKGLLDTKEADLTSNLQGVTDAFNFGKASVQAFLEAPQPEDKNAAQGTLIYTGATASVKGSAKFSSFASGKFAIRALSQSIAREFGPQGIHCCHAIIDGMILTAMSRNYAPKEKLEDGASILNPDSIAKAYLYLAEQDRSAFTQEIDLRPAKEKF